MAEVRSFTYLAIPASESNTPGPGYRQKSIPLRALEFSLDGAFLERLIGFGDAWLSSIKSPPKMKVQISHYVPHPSPLRDHDEAQALKILRRWLGVLGIKGSDLEGKAKGALERQVLAWWLRKKTVVSRKWVSEKLGMGDLSRVTGAVRKVNSGKESEIRRWKMQLEKNS